MTITRNHTSNRYCGPAALAALTGLHVDDVTRTLRVVSGKAAIRGVADKHMVAAIERLGYRATRVFVDSQEDRRTGRRPTLTQALAGALRGRKRAARYLVLVTGHYVTIQGDLLVDNRHTGGVTLAACPYRRRRVRAVWCVEPVAPVPPPAAPMTFAAFAKALAAVAPTVTVTREWADAPDGYRFAGGTHMLALQGTWDYALAQVTGELPLVQCGEDCDYCRDERELPTRRAV